MKGWTQVTRRSPCEICGGKSWCAVSTDGHVRKCMRNLWADGARVVTDNGGTDSALYFNDGAERAAYTPPVEIEPMIAPVEKLDVVYRALLEALSLSPAHRQNLRDRGLSDKQIDNEGFRSLGPGANAGLKQAMAGLFPAELLATVPGFFVTKYLGFESVEGICIPIRDERGRVIAIKVRRQGATERKYRYLTSSRLEGPSPGSPAHVPLIGTRGTRVRVTEGEFKATVCSALTDTFTISVPGVSQISSCLGILKALGTTHVVFAWDSDVVLDKGLNENGADNGRNPRFGLHPKQKANVAATSLDNAMHLLEAEGYVCSVEHWPEDAGKGLDDVLAAGRWSEVAEYTGQAAWDRVIDNLAAAKMLPRDDTKAKCSAEAIARSWPRERSVEELEDSAEDGADGPDEDGPEDRISRGRLAPPGNRSASRPEQSRPLGGGPEGIDDMTESIEGTGPEEQATPPTNSVAYASLDDLLGRVAGDIPVPKSGSPKLDKKRVKTNNSPKKEREPSEPSDFSLGDEVELARQLLVDLRGDSPEPVFYDRNEFWRFDPEDNLWHKILEQTVFVQVSRYSGRTYMNDDGEPTLLKLSASKIEGTIRIAKKVAMQIALESDRAGMFFDHAPRGMATKDKFLRLLDNGDIVTEPLGAEHRQTVCLPFNWDETATCPKWDAFYNDVFANCSEEEARLRQQALDEMIGGCLFGIATDYQKCFILLGGGSNGKGTWQKVIRRMFPTEFVSMMSPGDMLASRFALAGLVGKRLNIVGELPDEAMFENDKIKSVIAGDEMSADQKFGAIFNFVPQAGHVYSCNALPKNRDQSYGFYRRFIIVDFQRQFAGKDIKIKYEEQLATELPGIFARTVAAVQRLVRHGQYVAPDCSGEEIDEWKMSSDPIFNFLRSCCVVDKEAETLLPTLYTAYTHWIDQAGGRKIAAAELGQRLKQLGHGHRTKLARIYRLAILDHGMAASTLRAGPAKPTTH